MAYHIYHTRGIILGSTPRGESNRFYKIFTEELGLVQAAAQAVREAKSKLRYVLQDGTRIHVDLVRGKEVWRITSAIEERPTDIIGGDEQQKLFLRVCAFVSRLLQGEGKEKELFADLYSLANFMQEVAVPGQLLFAVENLEALRALTLLGYINPDGYEQYIKPGEYSLEISGQFAAISPRAVELINKALTSSHL